MEVLGLVDESNLDELLNDKELVSYFNNNVDNWDSFLADIAEFFKQEILSINKLKEYLTNLNYGDKTVAKAVEILSKSDEEKTDEEKDKTEKGKADPAETDKPIDESVQVIEPFKPSKETNLGDPRGKNQPKETFSDILKKEMVSIKEEMENTKELEKLDDLKKELEAYEDYVKVTESDPSMKPPKRWFNKMKSQGKDPALIGYIWSNLSTGKKSELRGAEGKNYGPAPKNS